MARSYKNTYYTNDFNDWYNHFYGEEYDGSSALAKTGIMTDADLALGKRLLSTYNTQKQITDAYTTGVKNETDRYEELISSSGAGFDKRLEEHKGAYERNSADLLKNYTAAQQELERGRAAAKQTASISYDKLKKYLPETVRAQGLSGMGISESTALEAYNSYMNNVGKIDTDFTEKNVDLTTAYLGNKTDLDSAYDAGRSEIELAKQTAEDGYKAKLNDYLTVAREKYDADMFASDKDENGNLLADNVLKEYTDAEKAYFDKNYAEAMDIISSSTYKSYDEMREVLKKYRGKISTDQMLGLWAAAKVQADSNAEYEATLDKDVARETALTTLSDLLYSAQESGDYSQFSSYLESMKDTLGESTYGAYKSMINKNPNEAVNSEQEQAETDKRVLEGKEYVSFGGNEYKLKEQLGSEASEIRKNSSFKSQLNKAGFTNPYDKDIPNGTTFEILPNNSVMGGELFGNGNSSWLIGGKRSYITYYNGEWYISENMSKK